MDEPEMLFLLPDRIINRCDKFGLSLGEGLDSNQAQFLIHGTIISKLRVLDRIVGECSPEEVVVPIIGHVAEGSVVRDLKSNILDVSVVNLVILPRILFE